MSMLPELGLYVSATDPHLRFIVEDVSVVDKEDGENDFFLVSVVAADGHADISAMGLELDPEEWDEFVESHELKKVGQ